jgi:peptide-methionine (S)-S-oxide reductase
MQHLTTGPVVCTQYRSAIFTHSAEQAETAEAVIAALEAEAVFDAPIVTERSPATAWYPAEASHQEYYRRNPNQPYCAAMIGPKVAKLRSRYANLLRENSTPSR